MNNDDKDQRFIEDGSEKNFHNLASVLKHLQNEGWKITKPSLYRHQKEGKLLPDKDGSYNFRAVAKYARTFLKLMATGKRVSEATDELQRKKLVKEIARLELGLERDQFSLEKEKSLYIRREEMDIELAGRAGILIAGLKHWVQSKAAEWISLTGGNMKLTGELINAINHDLDEHINYYAANREYEVVFEGEGSGNDATASL